MNLKSERVFVELCVRKNKGFSIIEILCALVILILVILTTFSALDYALKITVASRNRMNAFATAEQMAVATLASRKEASDPRVDSTSAPINGVLTINGVNQAIAMEAVTYREKISVRLDRLVKSPTFIVFLGK
ncbi:MAG: prepilin-type N-terminal cleavage/methylation domain-containing protein [Synergistaceae bacterium]|jgi:Tfp pilus assembly protein PilV|nr:prepilin-type N-terminal cleavage/methylation domain-containing protein [Synergistaceae bacterium]